MMKNWHWILAICVLVLIIATGCDAIKDKVQEIAPQAIEDAQEFIEEQNIDLQETQIRVQVIARA